MSRSRLSDLEQIAVRWYTEQRGRILGNTKHWNELTRDQRAAIMAEVQNTLECFAEHYSPEPTPHEMRNHG